jgi:hypothetical protein
MFRRTRAIETNRATKRLLSQQMAKARGSHYNNHGWARGRIMPSFKDADLAAIKARYESNYALITNDPKIAKDPVIIAALAQAKASEAGFYAALENVEAKSNLLRRWGAFRRFRQAAIAAEKAHDKLRAAVARRPVES